MSFNLPGMYLYPPSRDNLAPEKYERIISPHATWARICREYEFDDSYNTRRYLINMWEREQRSSPDQARPSGIREKEKLEKRVFSGDVVMLSDMYGPALSAPVDVSRSPCFPLRGCRKDYQGI
ncbi:HNH endonuclease domain-containing protein [Yersinia pseudotuberculosis]|nr:HNH endonuclease domain-containing protein [Yersinia pseudotuberculosis]